jgi:hypothetical protein
VYVGAGELKASPPPIYLPPAETNRSPNRKSIRLEAVDENHVIPEADGRTLRPRIVSINNEEIK